MSYTVQEQPKAGTKEIEYLVVDRSGRVVPPPNTFSTRAGALGRIAELERADALELAEKLKAKPPSPGMHCYGKIVGASDTLLIQHLGRDQYVLHQRADSDAYAAIEVDDLVRIIDGEVEYPDRDQGLSLTP